MPGYRGAGVDRVDVTEKQGAIARDAGSCVLVTDLEAHRTDWNRAVRIILILNVLTSGYDSCSVLGDELRPLSHHYTSDR